MSIDGLQCQVNSNEKDLNQIRRVLVKLMIQSPDSYSTSTVSLTESKLDTIQKKLKVVQEKLAIYEAKVEADRQQQQLAKDQEDAGMMAYDPPWQS
mmetsp:Transcript_47072/g.42170  ORF Transcript_47072/g.42170 Transcript_47072/m.42170 type:complete len:96 (+) Transcript_47072:75-362(+)